MQYTIGLAVPSDSESLLSIYAPYVESSAVSFETRLPGVEEFAERIRSISQKYPYLVAQGEAGILGYAYASEHQERAAYRFDVNVSVYVLESCHGQGVAHSLYGSLFRILAAQGYRNAYAGYTLPNEKSRKFHQKCGFEFVGTYKNAGYKLGAWHDVTWVGKTLMDYTLEPDEPIAMGDLPKELIRNALQL
jgi:phosphinothricin acetyltransferase